MGTAIIQQFNPASGYWNTLYELPIEDYDENEPIKINKYGGPYRTLFKGVIEKKVDILPEPVVEEEELEEEPEKEYGFKGDTWNY